MERIWALECVYLPEDQHEGPEFDSRPALTGWLLQNPAIQQTQCLEYWSVAVLITFY